MLQFQIKEHNYKSYFDHFYRSPYVVNTQTLTPWITTWPLYECAFCFGFDSMHQCIPVKSTILSKLMEKWQKIHKEDWWIISGKKVLISIPELLGISPQNPGGNPNHQSPFSQLLPLMCHKEHQQLPKADSYVSLKTLFQLQIQQKNILYITLKQTAGKYEKTLNIRRKKCVTSSPGLRRANKAHVMAWVPEKNCWHMKILQVLYSQFQ